MGQAGVTVVQDHHGTDVILAVRIPGNRYWQLGVRLSKDDGSIVDPGCVFVEAADSRTQQEEGALPSRGDEEAERESRAGSEEDGRWTGGGQVGGGTKWGAYPTGQTGYSASHRVVRFHCPVSMLLSGLLSPLCSSLPMVQPITSML